MQGEHMACYWVISPDVPGGRFLVPGCWNRVIAGDDAECQCEGRDRLKYTAAKAHLTVARNVEKISRAMCSADGMDPDQRILVADGFTRGGEEILAERPAWSRYLKMAEAAKDAMELSK